MAQRPTPLSVAVCTLIALHSNPSSRIYRNGVEEQHTGEEHLAKVIKHFVLNQDDGQEKHLFFKSSGNNFRGNNVTYNLEAMSLGNFLRIVAGCDGQYYNVAKFLLDDLNQTVSSVDSLFDLYSALRSTVAKGCIDSDSAHGIYIRKHCLGFEQLQFDSVGRFWEALAAYVEAASGWDSCYHDRSKFDPSCSTDIKGQSSLDEYNRETCGIEDDESNDPSCAIGGDETTWPLSPHQVSRTMMQLCRDLQNRSRQFQCTTEDLELHLQNVLNENPELTLAHFARFLNCVNHDERVGSLEHFHRYFDYAMIQERKDRLVSPVGVSERGDASNGVNSINNSSIHPNGDRNEQGTTKKSSQKRNLAQYVTIVLAALFQELGYDDMALMASREAVKVAQQSGDEACLAYALGWMHSLSLCNPRNKKDGLQSLKRPFARSGEYDLSSLIAGTSFQRAAYYVYGMVNDTSFRNLATSERISMRFCPSSTWESIEAASANRPLTMNAVGQSIYLHDVATNLSSFSHGGNNMSRVFVQQCLVGSGLWQSVGRSNFAQISSQVSMHCHDSQLSKRGAYDIASNVVTSVMCGSSPQGFQSVCTVDNLNRLRTKNVKSGNKLADKVSNLDIYTDALKILHRFNVPSKNEVNKESIYAISQICLQSLTQKLHVHQAESYEVFLQSHTLASSHRNIKEAIQAMWSSCLLLCRKGMFEDARGKITSVVLPLCEKFGQHFFRCFFLLQLVIINLETCGDDPTFAIPCALDCLALSEEFSIDSIHASALALLARIQFELGNSKKAEAMIESAMPILLKHAHQYFIGHAWMTLAKCTLAVNFAMDGTNQIYLLRRALFQLQSSAESFMKICDVLSSREAYYLIAHVCDQLPLHHDLRNDASRTFLSLCGKESLSVLPKSFDFLSQMFLT
mmetsp:Transcript_5945/g.11240  ORF Transcript_5945/g.11240 Transcript_5945/m.11240 type:complete len:911 (+) Transcript_5945:88-2820(+)